MGDSAPATRGRPSNEARIKALEAQMKAGGGSDAGPLTRPQVMAHLMQGFASIPDARIADRAEKASRVADRIYEAYLALCKGDGARSVYDRVETLESQIQARDRQLGETRDKLATAQSQMQWYRDRLEKAGMEVPAPEAVPV